EYRDHQYHEVSGPGGIRVVRGGFFEDRNRAFQEQQDFMAGIPRTVTMLESLIDIVKERTTAPREAATKKAEESGGLASRDVFIVHGRHEGPREKVARLIAKLRLKPIILHEQANEGRTLIEKFEGHSDVGYAVVLLTGDDRGGLIENDPSTYQ